MDNNIKNQENYLSLHKHITNIILNIDYKNIKQYLNIDYCNNEFEKLKEKIKNNINEGNINYLSNLIDKNNNDNLSTISNYYVKMTHLFSSIFNITSNNIDIIDNKLLISFYATNCLPEIKYVYTTSYDFENKKYIIDEKDLSYKEDLNYFCNIFLKTNDKKDYNDININNVMGISGKNNMIFQSYFKSYIHNLKSLINYLKYINNKLSNILNNAFKFKNEDDIFFIENIITIEKLDMMIEQIRDILIEYFFKVKKLYDPVSYYFKLFIFDKYQDTIKKRLKLLKN